MLIHGFFNEKNVRKDLLLVLIAKVEALWLENAAFQQANDIVYSATFSNNQDEWETAAWKPGKQFAINL